MQTNPAVEQNKSIKWSESPWNQSGRIRLAGWAVLLCHTVVQKVRAHSACSRIWLYSVIRPLEKLHKNEFHEGCVECDPHCISFIPPARCPDLRRPLTHYLSRFIIINTFKRSRHSIKTPVVYSETYSEMPITPFFFAHFDGKRQIHDRFPRKSTNH